MNAAQFIKGRLDGALAQGKAQGMSGLSVRLDEIGADLDVIHEVIRLYDGSPYRASLRGDALRIEPR